MALPPKALVFAVLASQGLFGCVAATQVDDGFEIYSDIAPRQHFSYALPDDAPPELKRLLPIALGHWNEALGTRLLLVAPSLSTASVKILYTHTERLADSPAHAELLGCQTKYANVADCTIKLKVPRRLDDDLPNVVFLFRQGPLDPALYAGADYSDVTNYLRDKLMLMAMVHEIGHTLGLSHAKDASCIMAAVPAGDLKFCPAEVRAVKRRLEGLAH